MSNSELARVIEAVGKDRGIKREIIVSALEQAVLSAAQKKYGPNAVLEAHFNDDTGDIDVFLFKKVVDSDDDMLEESEEIQLEEARKLDPDAEIGDELGVKVEASFGRIDSQTAKQVIFQKIRDAERDVVFGEYIHRKGEIITGIARRVERGNLIIDLGKTDAVLPRNEVIPGEQFRPGDRVQAYLKDVLSTTRGPQLYLSRACGEYVVKLFENEVPEIRDGIVEVKGVAREAGARTKIAVISKDRDVDPVGACVGMKGVRVQAVIQELKGEKIDIIPYSENPIMFVRSALAPAEISSISVDEYRKSMEIMVDDTQLSLAIGRKGQNVRLAANLTGWKLDIVSKSKLEKRTSDSVTQLQLIEGVSDTLAQAILQTGFNSVRDVAAASVEALQKVPGFESEEAALRLKTGAQTVVETAGDKLVTPGSGDTSSKTASDAKSQAEERLRQMLKQASDDSGTPSTSEES